MLALLLDAKIHTRRSGGSRVHAAADFFVGPLTSALEEDEIVTEVELPGLPPESGWAFEEFAQRSGDFAIAAVAGLLALAGDGRVSMVRLAAMGVDETPLRLRAVEADLLGATLTDALVADAARRARELVQPSTDLKASADYRRHLVEALTRRVLATAWARAKALAS